MKRSRTVLYLLFTDWLILVGTFAVALRLRHYDEGMNIVSRHHIIPEMVMMFLYVRFHSHFREFGLFSQWDWPKLKPMLKLLRIGLPIGTGIFVWK